MIGSRQRNIALLVASCWFMQNLDGTIVVTSAPKIGANLHVSSIQVSLVITAYLVTCAVLIPLGSWLIGVLGTRRLFLGAIVLFTVSSALCALSTDLGMLVAMRILQGCGAALMTPTGRVVALANVEKRDILRVMSFIIWPSLIAPVLAPLIGGIITTYASWRWIFLINIPLGVIAFAFGLRLMPNTAPPARQRLDATGFSLVAAGLGGLTYTAHLLSIPNPAPLSAGCGVVSTVFLVMAIRHLLRTPTPLLNLRLFSIPSFRASNGGMPLYQTVVGAIPFLLPLLFQGVFGWSAVKSGAFVLCVFLGNVGFKPATAYLIRVFGFRNVLTGANLGVALSVLAIGLIGRSTPVIVIVAILFFGGCARSMGFAAYLSLGYSDVPESQMRDANVVASTVLQLGSGFAIASGAVALHIGAGIASEIIARPAAIDGYTIAFVLLAGVAVISAFIALRIPADAGNSIRGLPESAPGGSWGGAMSRRGDGAERDLPIAGTGSVASHHDEATT